MTLRGWLVVMLLVGGASCGSSKPTSYLVEGTISGQGSVSFGDTVFECSDPPCTVSKELPGGDYVVDTDPAAGLVTGSLLVDGAAFFPGDSFTLDADATFEAEFLPGALVSVRGRGTLTFTDSDLVVVETITCAMDGRCPDVLIDVPAGPVTITPTPGDDTWRFLRLFRNGQHLPIDEPVTLADGDLLEAEFVRTGVVVQITGRGTLKFQDEENADDLVFTCDMDGACPEQLFETPAQELFTIVATPVDADWELTSLTKNGNALTNGQMDVSVNQGNVFTAVFTRVGPPLCTPTSDPGGPPSISFVNPFGGGCEGQILFIGGSNLGGVGSCVVANGQSLTLDAGSGNDVLRVLVPVGFGTGLFGFDVSTLSGTAHRDIVIASGGPAVPTSMSPNPVQVGGTLTITGTNLAGTTEVRFQGDAQPNLCTIVTATDTTVTCTIPNNPGAKTVFVANPCGGAVAPGGPLVVEP
jgi:hypothetical protein